MPDPAAAVTAVSVETVRYYQRCGLLEMPTRTGGDSFGGGVRRCCDEDVRRLRFIRAAQSARFTPEQIGDLLSLDATGDRERAQTLATERLAALDTKIAELMAARSSLRRLALVFSAPTRGPCPITSAFQA